MIFWTLSDYAISVLYHFDNKNYNGVYEQQKSCLFYVTNFYERNYEYYT
jgi:hypothetical protein